MYRCLIVHIRYLAILESFYNSFCGLIINRSGKMSDLIQHIIHSLRTLIRKCNDQGIIRHTHQLHGNNAAFNFIADFFLCSFYQLLQKLTCFVLIREEILDLKSIFLHFLFGHTTLHCILINSTKIQNYPSFLCKNTISIVLIILILNEQSVKYEVCFYCLDYAPMPK